MHAQDGVLIENFEHDAVLFNLGQLSLFVAVSEEEGHQVVQEEVQRDEEQEGPDHDPENREISSFIG